ncbi:DNA primase family protein [Testudinibacter sp. P27/CKL/0425]
MTQLIKARYLNSQDRNYKDELMILAGGLAYAKPSRDKLSQWRKLSKDDVPVLVGEKELKNLPNVQIVPEDQEVASIHQAGSLSNKEIEGIIYSIAKHSKVKTLRFYNQALQMTDYSEKVEKIRTGNDEVNKMVVKSLNDEIDLHHASDGDKVSAFLRWHSTPLRRDLTLSKTYHYTGTVWEEVSQERLERKTLAFYRDNKADYKIHTLRKLAELITLSVEEMPVESTDYIGFSNGVLNKKTGQFMPHNPDLGLRFIDNFPCNIASKATPHFNDWLNFVAGGSEEKKNAILAGLYMILTNQHHWGLFLEVTGIGGAGKSLLGEIAATLNGRGNSVIMEVKDFDKPETRSLFLGKSFAYSPDQKNYTGNADGLKAFTGGDVMTVKLLYRDPFDYKPTANYMMITNNPILFTDRNGGIARRRVIIFFDKPIPENKKDVNFIDKIKGEIYGIVHMLLKRFDDNPEEARQILESFRSHADGLTIKQKANHLIDFASAFRIEPILESDTPRDKNAKINGLYWGSGTSKRNADTALYQAYLKYCDCQNYNNRLSLLTFKQALPDALKEAGESAKFEERKKDNAQLTNIYWKDKHATFKEWEG